MLELLFGQDKYMNHVVEVIKWVRSNFLYLIFAIFIFLYVWWFRLNPIDFGPGEEATEPLIFGVFLLFIYVLILGILKLLKNRSFLRILLLVLAILFLVVNLMFLVVYFPHIVDSAQYGVNSYYITSNFPFLNCCEYYQLTQWQGIFNYETSFFGYTRPPSKFIYDKSTEEVGIVDVSGDSERLYMILGKSRQYYEGYAQLGENNYYVSTKCNRNNEHYCETFTYILYQCEFDNTQCKRLPLEYTGEDGFVILQVNELTEEIQFYLELYYDHSQELIFTYGQHPRCFVEGCSIIEK